MNVLTFCSRGEPCLALQETRIEVNQACDVVLEARVAPDDITGSWATRWTKTPGMDTPAVDGSLEWVPLGERSICGWRHRRSRMTPAWNARWKRASSVLLRPATHSAPSRGDPTGCVRSLPSFRARCITSPICTLSVLPPTDIISASMRCAGKIRRPGLNYGRAGFFCSGRIAVGRPWPTRRSTTQSSVHPSSRSYLDLRARDWHDYHYYYGHVMWDIETFAFPVLLLDAAGRGPGDARLPRRTCPRRRANAQLNGGRRAAISMGERPATR